MLDLDFDITNLRGAEYNPRRIEDQDIQILAESVKNLGMVKPLIVRKDLLVAGHQRTKALRALGITRAPAYLLPADTNTYDEVRFNQLHNGTDMDSGDENCVIRAKLTMGYNQVDSATVEANWRCKMAPVRAQIIKLIDQFGPWGGVVAVVETGEVIHCAQYAIAAHVSKTPLTVYGIPQSRKEEYQRLLGRNYGVFSYEHIKRETYVQTYAQPHRMVNGKRGGMNSQLYKNVALPWLEENNGKSLRILDFGSGQADSAMWMRKQGYNLIDVELFRRVGGSDTLDLSAINRLISGLCRSLDQHGLFDVVICDSVLNSIDTAEAEEAVLAFIVGICKPGGMVFFSGRSRERPLGTMDFTKSTSNDRRIEFLDKDGMTGLFRKGRWFFQKYHDEQQVDDLSKSHRLRVLKHERDQVAWQVQAVAPETDWDRLIHAAAFEFELPLPNGPIGRSPDVIAAINKAKV